jgi:hypothetical protein
MRIGWSILLGILLCGANCDLKSQTVWTGTSVADAFLAAGSAGNPLGSDLTANNYGGAGTLAISPAGSTKGEFQSLVKFDLAPALAVFDTTYGTGNWQITSITLTLASNFGVQGSQPNNSIFNTINTGNFSIDWLADDSWLEGSGNPSSPGATGVNFDSLGTLLAGGSETLGAYTYVPPGNNVPVVWTLDLTNAFLVDAETGGNLSFRFYASDNQVGYLFNARSFAANRPLITVMAVPEPSSVALLVGGLIAMGRVRKR